jgi:hypothetical protein
VSISTTPCAPTPTTPTPAKPIITAAIAVVAVVAIFTMQGVVRLPHSGESWLSHADVCRHFDHDYACVWEKALVTCVSRVRPDTLLLLAPHVLALIHIQKVVVLLEVDVSERDGHVVRKRGGNDPPARCFIGVVALAVGERASVGSEKATVAVSNSAIRAAAAFAAAAAATTTTTVAGYLPVGSETGWKKGQCGIDT